MESTWRLITRTTHAYDTSHHSKHHAAWMGRATQVSGIVRLVGVQRTVQKNGNVKSEANTLLVKNLQYVLSTFDLTLSCSSVPLLASTVGWLLCFFFLELPAVGSIQHSVAFSIQPFMDLAPQIRTLRRASRAVFPIIRRRVLHVSDTLPCPRRISTNWHSERDLKLTFLSVTDTYTRTLREQIPHSKPHANGSAIKFPLETTSHDD